MRGYPEVPIPSQLDDVIIVSAVSLGLHCVSGRRRCLPRMAGCDCLLALQ